MCFYVLNIVTSFFLVLLDKIKRYTYNKNNLFTKFAATLFPDKLVREDLCSRSSFIQTCIVLKTIDKKLVRGEKILDDMALANHAKNSRTRIIVGLQYLHIGKVFYVMYCIIMA